MNIVYVLICVNRTVLQFVPVTAALMLNEIRRVLLLGLQKEVGAISFGETSGLRWVYDRSEDGDPETLATAYTRPYRPYCNP